jgi:cytochrome c oxidase assembly protein subunit 15
MTLVAVVLVVATLVGVLRSTERGHRARIAAILATVLLFNEAILGALLVKLGYVTGNQSLGRVYLLSIHLTNTLLLLAALTMTVELLRRDPARQRLTADAGTVLGVSAALAATLMLGVTGSLAALGDTLFPAISLSRSVLQDFSAAAPWLLRFRLFHPTTAMIASAFTVWCILKAGRGPSRKLSLVVLLLLLFQLLLGAVDVLLLAPTWMQIVHLLGANLYWIALVLLAAHLLLDARPSCVRA